MNPPKSRKDRGILEASIELDWEIVTPAYKGLAGCNYPIFNFDGEKVGTRWKSFDPKSDKLKYAWPQSCKHPYYHLPDIKTIIAEHLGTLHIAAGEPDVLTFIAAGIRNVLCWLNGETSVPQTLVADLQELGVEQVRYYPDRDLTGCRAASKLHHLLLASGIKLAVYQVPGPIVEKSGNDVNSVWQQVQFQPGDFKLALINTVKVEELEAVLWNGDPVPPSSPGPPTIAPQPDFKQFMKDWIGLVVTALGPSAKKEGGVERWHCPLPSHKDEHPSFRISYDESGYGKPQCSCGIQDIENAWDQIASALKVEPWLDYRKKRVAEWHKNNKKSNAAPTLDPAAVKPVMSTPDAVSGLLKALQGNFDVFGAPIVWPIPEMWHLGGYCQVLSMRKAAALVGGTGVGKTTMIEQMIRYWLSIDEYPISDKPEWLPPESIMRDIQQLSGGEITYMDMLLHMHVIHRKQQGLEPVLPMAKEIKNERMEKLVKFAKLIQSQKGQQQFVNNESGELSELRRRMEYIADTATTLRKQGLPCRIAVLDYLQALPGLDTFSRNEEEAKQKHIKQVSAKANLFTLIVGQVNKAAEEKARSDGSGRFIGVQDMNWGRGDIFNLFVSMNPEYLREPVEKRGKTVHELLLNEQGEPYPTGNVIIAVMKNSMAAAPNYVKMRRKSDQLMFEVVQ